MDKLIVYRKVYEYLFWLRPTVERFSRVHKYSLGLELEKSCLKLLKLVVRANYADDKAGLIDEAVIEYEVQRVLVRLSYDYKLISPRQFEYASSKLDEIIRLLRGWRKQTEKK